MTAFYVGFTSRKARFLSQFIHQPVRPLRGHSLVLPGDVIYAWGDHPVPPQQANGVPVIRVEDGFVRSVGLGAAFAQPLSWVFDSRGLHHWGHQHTDIEDLITNCTGDDVLLGRAAALRALILSHQITKYNLPAASGALLPPRTEERARVLVVGQVSDDAALRGIQSPIKSNMALLEAVRRNRPKAEVIYRPHPDVVVGIRQGNDEAWSSFADLRACSGSIEQLFGEIDEVHVMNSLAGFEAILRDIPVVTYAQPFYAGWGLTSDVHPPARRYPRTLDQVVAAALIRYPKYRHPDTGSPIDVETAVELLAGMRSSKRDESLVQRMRSWLTLGFAKLADRIRLARAGEGKRTIQADSTNA